MIPLILATLASAPASLPASDPQVIGHYYVCEASVDLPTGKLTARRSLDAAGKALRDNDSASWSPAKYEGVSIGWWRWGTTSAMRLSSIPGSVKVFVRTERRLPRIAVWTVRRHALPGDDELAVPMMTEADPRLGSATVPLDAIAAYGAGADELEWTLTDARGPNGVRRVHARGRLSMTVLRDGARAALDAAKLLDAMSATPERRCVLTPEYYDPNSEI